MSTILSIKVGGLTAARTFQNDTKASAALLAFYESQQLGPVDATNQQKLDAIVDWLAGYIGDKARLRYVELNRTTADAEARTTYGFE